jgi:hypothetical protein
MGPGKKIISQGIFFVNTHQNDHTEYSDFLVSLSKFSISINL